MTAASGFNEDFLDILHALVDCGAEFIVVGAHAMAVHGVPRATGDLDLVVRPTKENAERVFAALQAFGAPIDSHGVTQADFEVPGNVYQIGQPPRRIDLLTAITGVEFEEAWASRIEVEIDEMRISFLGLETLRCNKSAIGRKKDLLDLELLGDPRTRS
ncbi:MAG: hypothetical protein GY769_12195 [bacterium]|nr:hypothetical protein [bacterium]